MWIRCPAPRDAQRIRLYRAQSVVAAYRRDPLPTIQDMQRYVDSILTDRWTQRRFGSRVLAPITVVSKRGRDASAVSFLSTIAVPTSMRSKFIVVHETCHIMTDRYYGEDCTEAHGPQFATFLLILVHHFLGADTCRDLLESFAKHGVEHSFRAADA